MTEVAEDTLLSIYSSSMATLSVGSILKGTGRASTVKRCPDPDSLNFPFPSQTFHALTLPLLVCLAGMPSYSDSILKDGCHSSSWPQA